MLASMRSKWIRFRPKCCAAAASFVVIVWSAVVLVTLKGIISNVGMPWTRSNSVQEGARSFWILVGNPPPPPQKVRPTDNTGAPVLLSGNEEVRSVNHRARNIIHLSEAYINDELIHEQISLAFQKQLVLARTGILTIAVPRKSTNLEDFIRSTSVWSLLNASYGKSCQGGKAKDVSGGEGRSWNAPPKFFCDRGLQEQESCVVYSFGSNGDVRFENQIAQDYPKCEIHIFDPTVESSDFVFDGVRAALPPRCAFHQIGIRGQSTGSDATMTRGALDARHRTDMLTWDLRSIMKVLGHTRLDILKMDIEGSEWAALKDVFGGSQENTSISQSQDLERRKPPLVGNLLVEVHLTPTISPGKTALDALELHALLTDRAGFRLVHSQEVASGGDECCDLNELSYVHRDWGLML